MLLAGPELLAILSQPLSCSLHCSPPGGVWVGAGTSIQSPSWGSPGVDSRLLPSFLYASGAQASAPSSEDYAENGPLGLLRILTICTLQVDLTYLFCVKEETKSILLFAGTQSCTQIKKDEIIIIETVHFIHTRTLQDDSEYTRGQN